MSGCATNLEGRAIFEVYDTGAGIHGYDWWVRNFQGAHRSAALGRIKERDLDWSGTSFYLKEADSKVLTPVKLEVTKNPDGTVTVEWLTIEGGATYTYPGDDGKVLGFTFDPYEGLERYTYTVVPRASSDEPMPASWNGTWLYEKDCPTTGRREPADFWEWVNEHSIVIGRSVDVLVTPYGQDTGVTNAIATRVFAFEKWV